MAEIIVETGKITQNYFDGLDFLSANYDEINGYDFYLDIFPDNADSGMSYDDFSHPSAIFYHQGEDGELHRHKMCKDTWENDYIEYIEENPMTLCGGLTYRGIANKLDYAQRMHALIFDLDNVGLNEYRNLNHRFFELNRRGVFNALPIPTYIVLSGNGVHLYYVFKTPIDLYPNIKIQMKNLKYDLTYRFWDYNNTTKDKNPQYQSINQAFRMVGSVNSKYGTVISAYRVGEKVTLDYLNKYVIHEENRVDVNRPFNPSKNTRAEAAEKYPEWYQRVVVEGNKSKKKWDIAGQKGHEGNPLYRWWKNKVYEIGGGHRYFYMMCLAIYATKCDIPLEQLKEDMQEAFEYLKNVEHGDNKLTQVDVESALETYSKEYYNFTIDDIEKLTNLRIERNKRNGRKQDEHLRRARAVQDVDYPDGSWRGNKSAKTKVKEYRMNNPKSKPKECIAETGLSKNTVYKWWNGENT